MKTFSEILTNRIANIKQVKKTAKELRAKIRRVLARYVIPAELGIELEKVMS